MLTLAFLAAFAAMLAYGGASVLQSVAARRAEGPKVLTHPYFLAGLALDTAGWGVSLLAFAHLPVFLVQCILAGSLAVTIVLAGLVARQAPPRRDLVAIAVVVAGLVLVSLAAGEESPQPPTHLVQVVTWVALGAVVAASVLSYRRAPMWWLACVSGLGFALASVMSREAVALADTTAGLLLTPMLYGSLLAGGASAALYARALEHGRVGPPTAIMWVIESVLASAVGVLWLGDTVRPGTGWLALLGIVVACVGCVLAAQSPAQE